VAASVDDSLVKGRDKRRVMLIGGRTPPHHYGTVGESKRCPKLNNKN